MSSCIMQGQGRCLTILGAPRHTSLCNADISRHNHPKPAFPFNVKHLLLNIIKDYRKYGNCAIPATYDYSGAGYLSKGGGMGQIPEAMYICISSLNFRALKVCLR